MIFTTSILLSSVIIVSADPDGIGKYLTINVQGEGYVTATKVNSGEVFLFNSAKLADFTTKPSAAQLIKSSL